MRNLLINPVLNKEFKLRFRSAKSFLGIFFYLLVVSIIVLGLIFLESISSGVNFFGTHQSRTTFHLLSFLQLVLILFMTPGLTAGVISSEREKQTLNILLTTSQSSTSIIIGKLISAFSYLLFLIIASLPIYSFVFLFGGVSPGQLMITLAFYLFTTFAFGSIGILFSTLFRKTIISIVTTYGVTLFLFVGTGVLAIIIMGISSKQVTFSFLPYFLATFNPGIVLLDIFDVMLVDRVYLITGGNQMPLWIAYIITYTVIMLLALFLSIRKLRPSMNVKEMSKE
ncbi:ABC transporter permease [Bacillus aquiflavi]|uniref:ABC transporter permease n=1 Tax=Bacillus aquiflavi TaxID=2672567 RepID=UPI001CAA3796|nr:ABC transporter permease [Bacillus aquiflavi]UAC49377.1 ABC transporter permease [Bacillus aquiflavi]